MKTLFDRTDIGRTGKIPMKNRIIRAAVSGRMTDGSIDAEAVRTYRAQAGGGAAAIVSGHTIVDPDERLLPVPRIYDDEHIPQHRMLTDEVRSCDAKILLQIAYIGSRVLTQSMMGGPVAKAPSSVANVVTGVPAREMRIAEIEAVQSRFAKAASRARAAGYDGVQIQAAHGFLLSQFLTPYYNRRTDRYGGSSENRSRMLIETYEAVRGEVGPDYPIWVKINSTDGFVGGITLEGCRTACRELALRGVDAIEVSGNWASYTTSSVVYFKDAAALIAGDSDVDVIVTGGNRSVGEMTEILSSTEIGYFGMARPLINEPNLVDIYRSECKRKRLI